MFGTQHLGLFMVSALLLIVTPGQDTLYIVGRSLSQGRRAGVLSAFAITCGTSIHTLAAAYGLAAILAASAQAFLFIKLAGAAYLTYLGIRMIAERATADSTAPVFANASDWAVFRAGLLTNVLNPKVALFFMAFLPQFVVPDAESRVRAFLFLGALFIVNGTLWCLFLAWAASAVNARLRAARSSGLILKRAVGAMFVGLGVRLAVSK